MSPIHDVEYLLEEVVTLPSLPTTVSRVTDMLDDPNTQMADVGKAISADPALALKTLRIVNSAYHGVREAVPSVDQAVVLLGSKVIRNLVLSAAVFDTFEDGAEDLLKHSVCCGVAMRCFAEEGFIAGTPIADEGEAFILGLLHDVGKILLQQFLPEEYPNVGALVVSKGLRPCDAEREVIGVDHAELGSRLAQKWRLSENLQEIIGGHHDRDCCGPEFQKAAALLALADQVAYAAGYPAAAGAPLPPFDEQAWSLSGLSKGDLQVYLEKFFSAAPQIHDLLRMGE